MIADDLVIVKIPSFSTVVTFDGCLRNMCRENIKPGLRINKPALSFCRPNKVGKKTAMTGHVCKLRQRS